MKIAEKELIGKLQELRQIKPEKEWVSLTKTQILGEIPGFTLLPYFKPALAGLIAVFVLFGLFGFAQSSLPGDFLYPIKKIIERGQAVFVSEADMPQVSLELANKRLEELTKIAETNQVKKLAPALNEFQASVSEVNKNISKMAAITPDIVDKVKKIEEKTEKISKTFGVVFESEGLDELKGISVKLEVERLISDLEKMTLAEGEEEVLSQMKELVGEGKYSDALELFLTEFNQTAEEETAEENEAGENEIEGEEIEQDK